MTYRNTKKLLIFLYPFCCLIFCYHIFFYNWFNTFTESINADQSISSYKLIQIWTQGDRVIDGKINPIAGDEKSFQEWQKIMNDFFKAVSSNVKKPIQYELILDDLTIKKHQKLLNYWQEKYPQYFKLSRIQEVIEEYPETSEYLEHCFAGNPALCSDVIRVYKIFEPNKRIVYIDFDFLLHLYSYRDFFLLNRKNRPSIKSELALGLLVNNNKIHATKYYSPKDGRIFFNNDLIVCSGENPLEYQRLKKEMMNRLKKNQYYLGYITKRQSYLNKSFNEYSYHRQSLINDMKLKPYDSSNYVRVVIATTGPGLYLDLQRKSVIEPYLVPTNVSTAGWADGLGASRGMITPYLLKIIQGEDYIDLFLKIIITNNDYFYARKRKLAIAEDLRNELSANFTELSQDQKNIFQSMSNDVYQSVQKILKEGSCQ